MTRFSPNFLLKTHTHISEDLCAPKMASIQTATKNCKAFQINQLQSISLSQIDNKIQEGTNQHISNRVSKTTFKSKSESDDPCTKRGNPTFPRFR